MELEDSIRSRETPPPQPAPSNPQYPPAVKTKQSGRRSYTSRLVYAVWSVVSSLANSLYEGIKRLTFFQVALRLLVFVIGVSVIQEICNNSPVLDVLNVPREFQDQGYTPEVVARRIKDRTREIYKEEKGIEERQHPLELPADSPLPDLQLPDANVSLKTAIVVVRQLLHFPPESIVVDVTLDHSTEDNNASGQPADIKTPRAQLRVVVRRFPGNNIAFASGPIAVEDFEDALSSLAQAVMTQTDPYVLGVYIFDTKGSKAGEQYFQEVIELEQRAAALNPDDPDVYSNWGNALYRQRKFAEASDKYQKASELNPTDPEVYNNWGNALNEQGKFAEASAKYQKATELKPDYARAYNNWGNTLDDQHNFLEAIAKYQKATELKPDFPAAYYNWGHVLADQHNFVEAIAKYRKATELNPNFADAYNNWGYALAKEGKFPEAGAKYKKATELKPDYAEAYSSWGAALVFQGKFRDAYDKYQKAVALKPNLAVAYNNWGDALAKQGRIAEAIANYDKALALDPNNSELYNDQGDALTEQGKFTDACAKYQMATELKPDYAEAYNNWARALDEQGKHQEAQTKRAIAAKLLGGKR